MDSERLDQLEMMTKEYYNREKENHQSLVDNRMPEIIVFKSNMKLQYWQSLLEIINDYLMSNERQGVECPSYKEESDMVNQPLHYTTGQFEVIDVIKDWLTEEEFRGYIKGNLIKYIARERYKNGQEDMDKAEFYLHYLNSDGEKGVK